MESLGKPAARSLIDYVKNGDVSGSVQYIKDLNFDWIAMAILFAAGILAGFLCKRYLKKIVVLCVVSLGAVIALEYVGLVTVQWDIIHGVVGTTPQEAFEAFRCGIIGWTKNNIPSAVSLIVGFLIGVKVG